MERDVPQLLRQHGIQPSAQRVAVGSYILSTTEHPSAELVCTRVRAQFPMVSRATVYNTLNLFVEKGLLRELIIAEGHAVFDPRLEAHHHFIDDSTGHIVDVPWEAVDVGAVAAPEGYEVREYQVIIRGRRVAGTPGPGA